MDGGSQTRDAAVRRAFDRSFADAPDLADLSFAARRVLVEAATQFHRHGAAATSVRDLAKACELSPGALYRHFAGKDDVLYRLVRHGHDSVEADLAAAPPTDDPVANAATFVRRYVRAHLARPEMARLVRREYVHLSPARRLEIVDRRRAVRDHLARLLGEGAASGRMRLVEGPDAATRAAMMVLDMCSRTSEWYDPSRPDAEPVETLAGRYVQAALRLVGVV